MIATKFSVLGAFFSNGHKHLPDKTRERSFLLKELRLSHVKERTSFLSKPRLNVTISTRFWPHLIFCVGIKFTSPHVTPHVVYLKVSHGIEVSSLEQQLRSLTAKFEPKRNREYLCIFSAPKKVKSRSPFLNLLLGAVANSVGAGI